MEIFGVILVIQLEGDFESPSRHLWEVTLPRDPKDVLDDFLAALVRFSLREPNASDQEELERLSFAILEASQGVSFDERDVGPIRYQWLSARILEG